MQNRNSRNLVTILREYFCNERKKKKLKRIGNGRVHNFKFNSKKKIDKHAQKKFDLYLIQC